MTIAGHTFDASDRCIEVITTFTDGVSSSRVCGKRWIDIMHCDEGCINQVGYAHVSTLNDRELKQIIAERARREKLYEDATKGVSGGGDYVPAPVVTPPVQDDTMMCLSSHTHGGLVPVTKEQAKVSFMANTLIGDDLICKVIADNMFEILWETNQVLLRMMI